jgi:hypothetical protein
MRARTHRLLAYPAPHDALGDGLADIPAHNALLRMRACMRACVPAVVRVQSRACVCARSHACARALARALARARVYSKCIVSPLITQPRVTIASYWPARERPSSGADVARTG